MLISKVSVPLRNSLFFAYIKINSSFEVKSRDTRELSEINWQRRRAGCTLNSDEAAANGQLGFGRDESRPSCGLLATPEDSGDAVCLCEQGGVNDAETESDGRLLDAADDVGRSQDE